MNLNGVLYGTLAAYAVMARQGSGHIVNTMVRWPAIVVLLGALLLSVGLIILGSATIDGEAPLRWRRLPLLLGLLSLLTLPLLVLSEGHVMAVAFLSPCLLLISILFAMLGYIVPVAGAG